MKVTTAVVAALAAAQSVSAHYIFQQLTVGSTKYPVFQYIRKNSNYNSPVTDLASNDLRCNEGASGAGTDTVSVKGGDSITFTLDTAVYHQGPISVYMSKAPGSASDYDGSGNWFKIKDFGPTFTGGSSSWPMTLSYTFSLPVCIPNGEYLLRIQSLAIHNPYPALPQFYISCAQVSFSGGGSVTPTDQVKIPGAFKNTDPGYTANIYSNFNSYTIPGPSVFSCNGAPGGDNGSNPPTTTLRTSTTSTTRAPTTSTSQPPATNCASAWAQCGGKDWTGATCCAAGTCKAQNEYYSQCVQ
ncbi:glycosyl hydrolase family 61 domain-containing protein [Sarocladium implicatum]|nr:glycosyl hydrolase family 61 domain-containing protein [Sarocladium implicatum]